MADNDFNEYMLFLAVADGLNFTKTAARLGIAQSTLSRSIGNLEARLGLRLFYRTTRNVALTEAGERLKQSLAPRIAGIEADIAALMALKDKPSGTVRIALSDYALLSVVWPKLRPVMRNHPEIKLELFVDNGFSNIVESGFDAGIRLGESLEKDMIAVRIGPNWRLVAAASPAYFATADTPTHPNQLASHACINIRQAGSGAIYAWEFEKGGQQVKVKVEGQLTFNTGHCLLDAMLEGYGIGYLPESIVVDHIRSGALVQVLDDWSPMFDGYFLYYPSRQSSPAFKVVADALRASMP